MEKRLRDDREFLISAAKVGGLFLTVLVLMFTAGCGNASDLPPGGNDDQVVPTPTVVPAFSSMVTGKTPFAVESISITKATESLKTCKSVSECQSVADQKTTYTVSANAPGYVFFNFVLDANKVEDPKIGMVGDWITHTEMWSIVPIEGRYTDYDEANNPTGEDTDLVVKVDSEGKKVSFTLVTWGIGGNIQGTNLAGGDGSCTFSATVETEKMTYVLSCPGSNPFKGSLIAPEQ